MRARSRIAGHVSHTPMLRHMLLDEQVGGTVLIKAEPLQRTGSFKLRGATNAVLQMTEAERRAGVVACSSGNHAQAVAAATKAAGIRATVYMPDDAPRIKGEATRRWGAEIITYDRIRDDREALVRDHAARTGAVPIMPFDQPAVIAGQGTLGLELVEDAAAAGLTMDHLLVCTGGGGLVGGCALAMEAVSPATRVHAVEPEGWDDMALSLAAGERVRAPGGSMLCDALLAPMPGVITFEVNRTRLAGAVAVTEAEVLAAMAFAFLRLKVVVEPGGAVALAALLSGRFPARGQVVGVVLSGGNVDPTVFARALA